jgi:hypothetical protein
MSFKDTLAKITGAKRDIESGQQLLRQGLDTAREQIGTRRAEVQHLETVLPPAGELITNAERLIDQAGQEWAKGYGHGLLLKLAGRMSVQELSGHVSTQPLRPELPFSVVEPVPFGAACFFRAADWKAAFAAAIRTLPFEAGPPTAERPALLERLRAELVELEGAEEKLVDELNANGITVAHRPEVIGRRDREARDRERAAERAQHQRWLDGAKKSQGPSTVHAATFKPGPPR